ncbi:MAG TPA: hypothetical protein VFG69_15270 [Nannocystaceae bacterium]|nr:hypothetical protein [Nannocystaceae bacterium]
MQPADDVTRLVQGLEFDDRELARTAAFDITTVVPTSARPVTLTEHQTLMLAEFVDRSLRETTVTQEAFARMPTRDQLAAAWRAICHADVLAIGDLSRGELGRVAAGPPDFDPQRYTMTEVQLARIIVLLVALLVDPAAMLRTPVLEEGGSP